MIGLSDSRVPLALIALFGVLLFIGCGSSEPEDPVSPSEQTVPETEGDATADSSTPVLPEFSAKDVRRLKVEVARADEEGMDPRVFAKVGASNTEWPQNLYGLGCREVGFGSNRDLEPVVERYRAKRFPGLEGLDGCSPINSFSRRSAATVSGVWTEWLLTPTADLGSTGIAPPTDECGAKQTPLECEIELLSPRWVTILSGTNDALLGRPLGQTFKGVLAEMIDRVRELGPVPVLSTLPPMAVAAHNGQSGEERIAEANRIIEAVASEMSVPLINLHAALMAEGMVDQGLAADGLHLGVYGGENQPDIMRGSAMLTIPALKYGANRRNQLWLKALERLDRTAASG